VLAIAVGGDGDGDGVATVSSKTGGWNRRFLGTVLDFLVKKLDGGELEVLGEGASIMRKLLRELDEQEEEEKESRSRDKDRLLRVRMWPKSDTVSRGWYEEEQEAEERLTG